MHNHPNQMNGVGQSMGPGQRMFSFVGAAIVAFFVVPIAFEFTVSFVEDYAQANYGLGGRFVRFIWAGAVGLLTFGGASLALSALPRISLMGIVNFFRSY